MQIAELKRFAPAAKHTVVSGLVQAWPYAEQAEITTPARICHFVSQCFVESKGFTDVEEDLKYSAKRLTVVWPKRFPTLASAAPYANNPQALANKVYGGRMGNSGPDEGWKYRGRGIKQITGKDNYRACGRALGIDLMEDPDALFDPAIGARAAIWYWSQAGCNRFADKNDIRGVTKAINDPAMPLYTAHIGPPARSSRFPVSVTGQGLTRVCGVVWLLRAAPHLRYVAADQDCRRQIPSSWNPSLVRLPIRTAREAMGKGCESPVFCNRERLGSAFPPRPHWRRCRAVYSSHSRILTIRSTISIRS